MLSVAKRAVRSSLGAVGLELRRVAKPPPASKQPSPWELGHGSPWDWQPILDAKLTCPTVIDVGAAGGTPSLFSAFPDAYLVLIEPVREFRRSLERILVSRDGEIIQSAIGSKAGETPITVLTDRPLQSSMHDRAQFHSAPVDQRTVKVETLDDITFERRFLRLPYFLKIDVEGNELDALRGAEKTLADTSGIAIEMNTSRSYPTLTRNVAEIDAFLKDHGFGLFAVLDAEIYRDKSGDGWRQGAVKSDLLYVRRYAPTAVM